MSNEPPPCPRCERADRVGEIEVNLHLGGEWAAHRMWACGRCHWIVATLNVPATE